MSLSGKEMLLRRVYAGPFGRHRLPAQIGSLLLLGLVLTGGCSLRKNPTGAPFANTRAAHIDSPVPDLGPKLSVEPGIDFYDVDVSAGKNQARLWIYLPSRRRKSMPCILIAPAGSRMFHGMGLAKGDEPEHLPYVRQGYVVVAYELEGPLPEHPSDADVVSAVRQFKNADGGLVDAKLALDYIAAKLKFVNKNQIYAVGHSSAATAALLVAAHDSRIKACVAYAPVCDVEARIGDKVINVLTPSTPDFRNFIQMISPIMFTSALKCPTLIFHADDDSTVSLEDDTLFVKALKRTNHNVTFLRVPTGNHYDSMIQQGIPNGIAWLNRLRGAR